VNGILRGVLIAPGTHDVEFWFLPKALWAGAALTVIGFLFVAVLLFKGGSANHG
jgi:hypothetical protein